MARNKFFTKQGWLTQYALACGYLHRTETRNYSVELMEDGPGLYRVSVFVRTGVYRVERVVENITQARRLYGMYCYGQPSTRYEPLLGIDRMVYA